MFEPHQPRPHSLADLDKVIAEAEQVRDRLFDRSRVRASVLLLQCPPTPLLAGGHAAAATHLAFREAVDEMRFPTDEHVIVIREVLAPVKAHEAVETYRFIDRALAPKSEVCQQRLAPEPLRVPRDCLRRDAELASDLPIPGTTQQSCGNGSQELGTLEPVARGEGPTTESASATETLVALRGQPAGAGSKRTAAAKPPR